MKAHSNLVSGSHPLVHSGCLRATAPSPVSARLKNQMKQAWHLRNYNKVQTGNWSPQQLVHLVPASSISTQIFLQFQEIEISAILLEILLQIEQSIRIGLDFHFRTGLNSSLHTIILWGPLKFINWCRILLTLVLLPLLGFSPFYVLFGPFNWNIGQPSDHRAFQPFFSIKPHRSVDIGLLHLDFGNVVLNLFITADIKIGLNFICILNWFFPFWCLHRGRPTQKC